MGLLVWPSPQTVTIEPTDGKPLEISVHQSEPNFSSEDYGKHILIYTQGPEPDNMIYKGRVFSMDEKRTIVWSLMKQYAQRLLATNTLVHRREAPECNCKRCHSTVEVGWSYYMPKSPGVSCIQRIIDIRNGLPNNDLVSVLWDLRNELKDIFQLLQEEPDLETDFRAWVEILPDSDLTQKAWGNWDPTSEDKEFEEAKQMLFVTGEYDGLVVYALYKDQTG